MEQHRTGGRGDAPRRARLCPEALENTRLLAILRTQIELRQALRQASRLEAENRILRAESRPTFLAKSPAMAPVLELIGQIGPSDANVLITGEHGTGKEVVARTLHALSSRATKPMVTVNAGGYPKAFSKASSSDT